MMIYQFPYRTLVRTIVPVHYDEYERDIMMYRGLCIQDYHVFHALLLMTEEFDDIQADTTRKSAKIEVRLFCTYSSSWNSISYVLNESMSSPSQQLSAMNWISVNVVSDSITPPSIFHHFLYLYHVRHRANLNIFPVSLVDPSSDDAIDTIWLIIPSVSWKRAMIKLSESHTREQHIFKLSMIEF